MHFCNRRCRNCIRIQGVLYALVQAVLANPLVFNTNAGTCGGDSFFIMFQVVAPPANVNFCMFSTFWRCNPQYHMAHHLMHCFVIKSVVVTYRISLFAGPLCKHRLRHMLFHSCCDMRCNPALCSKPRCFKTVAAFCI